MSFWRNLRTWQKTALIIAGVIAVLAAIGSQVKQPASKNASTVAPSTVAATLVTTQATTPTGTAPPSTAPSAATRPAATRPAHAVNSPSTPDTAACTRQVQQWLSSPLQQVPGTVKNAIGDINQDAAFYIQYSTSDGSGSQVFLNTIGAMVIYLTTIDDVSDIPNCADPEQLYGYLVPSGTYLGDADTLSQDSPGEAQTLSDAKTVQSDYQALKNELATTAPRAQL
jgi:hypothetical protein